MKTQISVVSAVQALKPKAMEEGESVIVISDDEEMATGCFDDSSVMILDETSEKNDSNKTNELVDEELSITYSKRPEVMPHARYDCTTNLFSQTENETKVPIERNSTFCQKCYCYICDNLASKCPVWTTTGYCHCNAHKRSTFWKAWRDKTVLGGLEMFKFDLLEIDADLRQAEYNLFKFEAELSVEHGNFLMGYVTPLTNIYPCLCRCHVSYSKNSACSHCIAKHVEVLLYDYSKVFDLLSSFLDKADKERPKTAAVMLLGAAKHIATHKQPSSLRLPRNNNLKAHVTEALPLLLLRITTTLQSLLVTCDFNHSFSKKLRDFFQSLTLPLNCRSLSSSLNIIQWDDPLLMAVLRGQNVSGERFVKGKRETLCELIQVVQARVEKLREQKKYRELARYLKVVKSNNKMHLQSMRDYIPFFLCKAGDFQAASQSFFHYTSLFCCCACRLTPTQFTTYLKILRRGQVPVGKEPFLSTEWEPIKGANPLTKSELIKCGLKILYYNSQVYMHPDSWADFVQLACSSADLTEDGSLICVPWQEPEETFQQKTRDIASAILMELEVKRTLSIPRQFHIHLHNQALLLLVTQALACRLLRTSMLTLLNVVMAFKHNLWALKFLLHSIKFRPEALHLFIKCLLEDLFKAKDLSLSSQAECEFIGDFIIFCLSDSCPSLLQVSHQIVENLLCHWNEQQYPWQTYLASILHKCDMPHLTVSCRYLELKSKLNVSVETPPSSIP
ncbi:uncharacterized protein LOC136712675 [Amia ocellicauda]|uniref:uncharacterized protein LOC136712675 n=1 Tax=Amia ocellicauda TaxID=2972642 RepID=UPI0034645586